MTNRSAALIKFNKLNLMHKVSVKCMAFHLLLADRLR